MPQPFAPPHRGSPRSRAAATLSRHTLRRFSAALPPEKAWGLWLTRRVVAGVMTAFGPPLDGVSIEHVDTTLADGRRVVGEWVRGPGVTHSDRAIYYLHGSGYAICSARTHRRLTGWLSTITGLPVFTIDYRLAPRHPFPAAADDVRAGWDWLRHSCALSAKEIVIAGDSAGGHLATDLLLHTPEAKPAALVLFSPLVDLTFGLAAEREKLRPDPAITAADAARLVKLYWRGLDPGHPRLAHDLATGPTFPPTLIQVGGAEMLVGDAHWLTNAIQTAGGSCELQIWPDQVHVFQALPRMSPDAKAAMTQAAQFITDSIAQRGDQCSA